MAFSDGPGLNLLEFLAEEVQADARRGDHPLKTDSKAPLPRTAFTQFIEGRNGKLVPAWSLLLNILVSLVRESTLKAMERENWTRT